MSRSSAVGSDEGRASAAAGTAGSSGKAAKKPAAANAAACDAAPGKSTFKYTLALTLVSAIALLMVIFTKTSTAKTSEAAEVVGSSSFSYHKPATRKEYQEAINSECAYVFYKVTWCGHCKALLSTIDEFRPSMAKEAFSKSTAIVEVDCETGDNKDICSEIGVRGYPTVKFFSKGAITVDSVDARDESSIKSLLNKCNKGPLSQAPKSFTENLVSKTVARSVFMFFFPKDDQKHKSEAETATSKYHYELDFHFTEDYAQLNLADGTKPHLSVHHPNSSPRNYNGPFDAASIELFITNERLPLVGEINRETYNEYMKSGKMVSFFFVDDDEQRKTFSPILEKLSEKYREKLNFAFISAKEFGAIGVRYGLRDKEWPALMIADISLNTRFPLAQQGTGAEGITKEAIESFVENYVSGKAKSFHMSEKPVEDPKEVDFMTVVHDNFEEKVIANVESGKAVFIFYHAEWCGHCKSFAPTFEKVAKMLNNHKDKVLFVKYDGTKNDLHEKASMESLTGFPTIVMHVKGAKKPINFDGARTKEGVIEFVGKNVDIDEKIIAELLKPQPEENEKGEEKTGTDGSKPAVDEDQITGDEL